MGCFSQDPPAQTSYAAQTRDTLQAQVDLAPQQYQAESQYQPLYANLALNNISKLMAGNPGGPQQVTKNYTANETGWYDGNGNFVSPGQVHTKFFGNADTAPQDLQFGRDYYTPGMAPSEGDAWHTGGEKWDVTNTVNTPAQPGLSDIMAQSNTAQRAADIGDVAALGPSATAAMMNANPAQKELLDKLNSQANSDLDAGSGLSPEQARAMQQASRAAFAARGMAGSNMGISDELLKQFNLGQQLLTQRRQFAQSVMGNNQAVVGDPMMAILGRPSGGVSGASSIAGSSGPSMFNPESPLAGQITAGNQAYAAMFAKPSVMSDVNSVLGATGSLVGGLGAAGI